MVSVNFSKKKKGLCGLFRVYVFIEELTDPALQLLSYAIFRV